MPFNVLDASVAPVWLAATSLVAVASWRLGSALFPRDSLFERLLHGILLGWAMIVSSSCVLGTLHIVTGPTLISGVTIVAAFLLFVATRWRAAGAVTPTLGGDNRSADKGDTAASCDTVGWRFAWAAWFSLWIGWVIAGSLLEYPQDFDSLMYHIPLVDQWLRAQSLYAPACAVWYVAGNNEALELWLVSPFSGDFLIGLANLTSASLLALGSLELARRLHLPPASCHLAALAVVANYVVTRQLLDNENDVAVASLFVTSLAYTCRYARNRRDADLCLAAVSLGLLAGVKYYALGYALVGTVGAVAVTGTVGGIRAARRVALWTAVGFALFAAYWYIRNAWYAGSPLYPRGWMVATDLSSQMRPDIWKTTLLGNSRPERWGLLTRGIWRSIGPVGFLAAAAAPMSVLALLWPSRGFDVASHSRAPAGLLAAMTAGAALVAAATPFFIETTPGTLNMLKGGYLPARFSLCFLTLACIGAIATLNRLLSGTAHVTSHALLAIVLIAQALFLRPYPIPGDRATGIGLAVDLFLLTMAATAVGRARHRRSLFRLAAVATPVALSAAIGGLSGTWHAGFAKHYDAYYGTRVFSYLEQHFSGDDRVRVAALAYRYYPLLGSRRQFGASRPQWVRTYSAFSQFIEDHTATHVVVVNRDLLPDAKYARARRWLDDNPDRFENLGVDRYVTLYRVRDENGDALCTDDACRVNHRAGEQKMIAADRRTRFAMPPRSLGYLASPATFVHGGAVPLAAVKR